MPRPRGEGGEHRGPAEIRPEFAAERRLMLSVADAAVLRF